MASSYVRSALKPDESVSDLERARLLCLHLVSFGPVLYPLATDRSALNRKLATFDDIRHATIRGDLLADYESEPMPDATSYVKDDTPRQIPLKRRHRRSQSD